MECKKNPDVFVYVPFIGKLSQVFCVFRNHVHDGLSVERLFAAVECVAVFADDARDAEPFALFRFVEV